MTTAISAATGRDDFLRLLVTQLQHQDPLQPVEQENFIAQLAQFSTLQGIESLNASFADMLQLQQMTQGAQIIGKHAIYLSVDGASAYEEGTVTGITSRSGIMHLIINDELVALHRIQSLGLPPN
jgi:flagellar basal-body rod modification protein FlgD